MTRNCLPDIDILVSWTVLRSNHNWLHASIIIVVIILIFLAHCVTCNNLLSIQLYYDHNNTTLLICICIYFISYYIYQPRIILYVIQHVFCIPGIEIGYQSEPVYKHMFNNKCVYDLYLTIHVNASILHTILYSDTKVILNYYSHDIIYNILITVKITYYIVHLTVFYLLASNGLYKIIVTYYAYSNLCHIYNCIHVHVSLYNVSIDFHPKDYMGLFQIGGQFGCSNREQFKCVKFLFCCIA